MSKSYDADFFRGQLLGVESASRVIAAVNALLSPESVLDVGCGAGIWLAEWEAVGVRDLRGLDGSHVPTALLRIDRNIFTPIDLEQHFDLGRRFDLVQSLEVAEHLTESRATSFVEDLCHHGDTVLFSAAIPGQGGTHHVNEAWPSYWAQKFRYNGFAPFDIVRPLIWDDPRIATCYRQNVLIFSRVLQLDESETAYLDVVHPNHWENLSLRYLLSRTPPAVLATLVGRFRKLRQKLRSPWPSPGAGDPLA